MIKFSVMYQIRTPDGLTHKEEPLSLPLLGSYEASKLSDVLGPALERIGRELGVLHGGTATFVYLMLDQDLRNYGLTKGQIIMQNFNLPVT